MGRLTDGLRDASARRLVRVAVLAVLMFLATAGVGSASELTNLSGTWYFPQDTNNCYPNATSPATTCDGFGGPQSTATFVGGETLTIVDNAGSLAVTLNQGNGVTSSGDGTENASGSVYIVVGDSTNRNGYFDFEGTAASDGSSVTGLCPTPSNAVQCFATNENNAGNSFARPWDMAPVSQMPTPTTTSAQCAGNGQGAQTCTAMVTPSVSAQTPTGTVAFSDSSAAGAGTFSPSTCPLAATTGGASCSVTYTPPCGASASVQVTASYGGGSTFAASSGSTNVTPPACSLTASIAVTGANGQPFSGGAVGQALNATVTLTNSSTSTQITAIAVNPALTVSPAADLTQTGGPTPAPPATLAPGQSASYVMSYTVASLGTAQLSVTATGTEGDAPDSASASATVHLGQPLLLGVSFEDGSGTPVPDNTIKLADSDSGEVAQNLTAVVTVTNRSSLTQTNLSLNGPLIPSFHQTLPTQGALPVSVTGGPTPSSLPASLAPGASTQVRYPVQVSANGAFDFATQVLSSDSGGATNVSTGLGTLTANPTALLLVKLHPVSDISGLITAGQPVLLAGTVTNLSNTQALDLMPIAPTDTGGTQGNVGGGLVTDSAQSPLTDGVIPPLAGKLKPSEVREVSVELDTAPVPGTRATVTFAPQGFVVNDDGSETQLTSDQIRLGEGTSPIELHFDTRDLPHSSDAASIAGNFAKGAFIGMSEWYLSGLHAAYPVLLHPFQAAFDGGQHIARFVLTTPAAVQQTVGAVQALYLLDEGITDMPTAAKAEFVTQLLKDYQASAGGQLTTGIQSAAQPVLDKFANAVATGDYDQVAQMSGYGLSTGAGQVADAVLTDLAFEKIALLAKAPAGLTVAESPLGEEISLAQAVRDSEVKGKAGAALKGADGAELGAGVNLLAAGGNLLEDVYGLTTRQVTLLRDFCESNGITVALRSRSKNAAELIKRGVAVSKNLVIKLKGVNSIDVKYLGYAQTDLNKIVWAEPISPEQLERNIAKFSNGVDATTRELIEARYEQRVKEWHNIDYRQKINTWDATGKIKLQFDGAGSGVGELDKARVRYRRFTLSNNPAIEALDNGNKRYYKRFEVAVSDAKNAKLVPVTQDVDLVAILGGNGEILPAPLRAKAYEYLEDILGIEHPDTIPWVRDGEVAFEAKTKLLVDHLPGGEALATFGADGSVRTSFFDPNLTVFNKVTQGGYIVLDGAYNNPTAPIAIGALGKLLP